MNKRFSFTINAIAIAFVAVFIEQVGHESSHGFLATLVGAEWTQLNLFFAEHEWIGRRTAESLRLGGGIIAGGAAIINILLALASMVLFKKTTSSTLRLFWFYMAALNLFAGFGYLFTDPLFYQRDGRNLGDWKFVVELLGGGWNVRLPIALVGAAGVLWGFMWVGRNAHAFLPGDKPTRLQTSIRLLLIPYIAISLIFTLLAFAGPVKEIAPIIAIKYWFGFFGIGWGAFMAGMWISAPAELGRSEVSRSIHWGWVTASILLLGIAVFILLPTIQFS